MPVGEARSAAALGTKENPVIAPPAVRLTSAVTCCHRGRPAESISSPLSWLGGAGLSWLGGAGFPGWAERAFLVGGAGRRRGRLADELPRYPSSWGFGRCLRIACTCGLPGSFAFANRTAASCAARGAPPTIHLW